MSEKPLSNWQRAQLSKRDVVTVPFAHLNPTVQALIGTKIVPDGFPLDKQELTEKSLKNLRFFRGVTEITALATGAVAGHGFFKKSPFLIFPNLPVSGYYVLMRQWIFSEIKDRYAQLADAMKKNGVLQTRFESKYPVDWINPAVVAETHPLFSVDRKGNVSFRRVTQAEFHRLKYQEKFPGKAGFTLWRWRGTLRKPLAPEKERQRWFARLAALARRFRPVGVRRPGIAFAPIPKSRLRLVKRK